MRVVKDTHTIISKEKCSELIEYLKGRNDVKCNNGYYYVVFKHAYFRISVDWSSNINNADDVYLYYTNSDGRFILADTFEEFLNNIPSEEQEEFLFHLDLFA